MGPAASARQERTIAAIRARLSPDDEHRFRIELALAYGTTGKKRTIDAWVAIANGDGAHEHEGTTYVETTGHVVMEHHIFGPADGAPPVVAFDPDFRARCLANDECDDIPF